MRFLNRTPSIFGARILTAASLVSVSTNFATITASLRFARPVQSETVRLVHDIPLRNCRLPRLPIYQALQVGELWRWRNEVLEVLILAPRTGYVVAPGSRVLPGFPIEIVCELIAKRDQLPDTALIRTFRTLIETRRD